MHGWARLRAAQRSVRAMRAALRSSCNSAAAARTAPESVARRRGPFTPAATSASRPILRRVGQRRPRHPCDELRRPDRRCRRRIRAGCTDARPDRGRDVEPFRRDETQLRGARADRSRWPSRATPPRSARSCGICARPWRAHRAARRRHRPVGWRHRGRGRDQRRHDRRWTRILEIDADDLLVGLPARRRQRRPRRGRRRAGPLLPARSGLATRPARSAATWPRTPAACAA